MNAAIQRRSAGNHKPTLQTRDDGAKAITGYASVFYDASDEAGTQYEMWPDLVERIMPGAFNRAIAEQQDVRGLMNHDSNLLLGRTKAGTMTLSVDSKGLRYEIVVNEADQDHVRTAEKLARGDLTGSSFGFIPTKQAWREIEKDGKTILYREIEDLDLFDVGPVTFPAYTGATSGLRGAGVEADEKTIRAEYDAWKAGRAVPANNAQAIADARLREIQIESDSLAMRG